MFFSDVFVAAVAAAPVVVLEQKGECLTLISWEKVSQWHKNPKPATSICYATETICY